MFGGPGGGSRVTSWAEGVADPRLLVTVDLSEGQARILEEELAGVPWVGASHAGPGPWPHVEAMFVGLLSREMPQYEARLTPSLQFVQSLFTGLDRFPFSRFPAPVRIAGNGGGYAVPVAEHALMLILALAKNLLPDQRAISRGERRRGPASLLLRGKQALLVGYGEIGRVLSPALRALGLRIVAVNRSGRGDDRVDMAIRPDRLIEELERSHVIVNLLPLTRETRGFFSETHFSRMRPDVLFVNVGRGATVDAEALARHVRDHPGFHFASDVWWDEREGHLGEIRGGLHIRDLEFGLGTPHDAGLADGSRDLAVRAAAQNLARYFRGEVPRFVARREDYLD